MMAMERPIIYRAGLIPYFVRSDGVIEMMFMTPSDPKYGGDEVHYMRADGTIGTMVVARPQIAKGKVDIDDDTHKDTAIREANEELGLVLENVIGDVREVGVFMGRTTVFIAQVKSKYNFDKYSYETGCVDWMTMEDFHKRGRPLHVPVVEECHKMMVGSK